MFTQLNNSQGKEIAMLLNISCTCRHVDAGLEVDQLYFGLLVLRESPEETDPFNFQCLNNQVTAASKGRDKDLSNKKETSAILACH